MNLLLYSASVFGVSAESMQCSTDSRGNSVPMILLLMQDRLYRQGGLKVPRLWLMAHRFISDLCVVCLYVFRGDSSSVFAAG